jgi:adhesin HecA-like repeat protein
VCYASFYNNIKSSSSGCPSRYLWCISSGYLDITSDNLLNSGTLGATNGEVTVSAKQFVNNGGNVMAAFGLSIAAGSLTLGGGTFTGDTVTLAVTNQLVATGGAVVAKGGVTLSSLPKTSSLLGATVQLTADEFATSDLVWSANDIGPSLAGYNGSNAPVGTLILWGGYASLMTLSGLPGHTNAIYCKNLVVAQSIVDTLDTALPGLVIADGFRVYFGTATSDTGKSLTDVLLTSPSLAGKVVQVAGVTATSPTVIVTNGDGQSLTVPWALRFSPTIDSDGDGIPNLFDASPFDPVVVSSTQVVGKPEKFAIRWNAAAGKTYQVEYATDVSKRNWKVLTTVTNTASQTAQMEVKDPISANMPTKVYRVVYTP